MKTLKFLLVTIVLSIIITGCDVEGDYEYSVSVDNAKDLPVAYSNVIQEIESRGFLVIRLDTECIANTYIVTGEGLNHPRYVKIVTY